MIKFQQLRDDFKIPTKAFEQDACWDLYATSTIEVLYEEGKPYLYVYYLGFATELPVGHHAKVYPRSSIRKTYCQLVNSVGIIDESYRGEWQVTFISNSDKFPYQSGERIAQFEIMKNCENFKFEKVLILSETDRGRGGHGSSGK